MAPALVAMMVVMMSAVIVERRPGLLPNSLKHITAIANEASAANARFQVSAWAEDRTGRTATLDDYDMLANFDVLSELPKPGSKVVD